MSLILRIQVEDGTLAHGTIESKLIIITHKNKAQVLNKSTLLKNKHIKVSDTSSPQ